MSLKNSPKGPQTKINLGSGYKNIHLKYAQGTVTSKFMQGRNSDVNFQARQSNYNNFGNNKPNDQASPIRPARKHPHHLKISDRLHSNLITNPNSTFMAIERSKSGIGENGNNVPRINFNPPNHS